MPTRRNKAPVETPWLIICITPPLIASEVKANVPSTMKPRWATEEYATRRFRSFCMVAAMAPQMMPMTARVKKISRLQRAASGKRYTPKRSKP